MLELIAVLGPLSTLCFVAGAITFIIGFKTFSIRLLLGGMVLALTMPLLTYALHLLSLALPVFWGAHWGKIILFSLLSSAVLLLGGWLRFRRHKTMVEHFFTGVRLSSKQRLDR